MRKGGWRLVVALWLLLVLLAHALLLWHWQRSDPRPRLDVRLSEPLRLRPPPQGAAAPAPPAAAAPTPRAEARLRAAVPGRGLAPLQTEALPEPLPPPPLTDTPLAPLPALSLPAEGLAQGEPGPVWPPSTRLRYRVDGHFRGPVQGDAEVEWLRQGEHYQVRLRLGVGPRAAPFIERELLSEGLLGDEGIRPQRYEERTRLFFGAPRVQQLRQNEGWLLLANGFSQPAPPGWQDSASQFVQLAWLLASGRAPLQLGAQIQLPLALPRQLLDWRYELRGEQALDTVLGPLRVWHLAPLQGAAGALQAEVWLAPELRFLPVQLRIEQTGPKAAWLLLTLAEPPLAEAENLAPPAASSAASSPASSPP